MQIAKAHILLLCHLKRCRSGTPVAISTHNAHNCFPIKENRYPWEMAVFRTEEGNTQEPGASCSARKQRQAQKNPQLSPY